MNHRTACQLLIPHQIALERDRVQQQDPRESAQQQNPRAKWMELRMMAQVEQFSSFPHAASRALSLLLENTEMVALKEPTTVASQAQRVHVARAEKVSPELATEH